MGWESGPDWHSAGSPIVVCTILYIVCRLIYYSKGFPAEVANHLANTAGVRYQVMPAVADIPCSTSMYHLHFF